MGSDQTIPGRLWGRRCPDHGLHLSRDTTRRPKSRLYLWVPLERNGHPAVPTRPLRLARQNRHAEAPLRIVSRVVDDKRRSGGRRLEKCLPSIICPWLLHFTFKERTYILSACYRASEAIMRII